MTVNTAYGKITATEDVLNVISLNCSMAAIHYEKEGMKALSDKADTVGREIFNALNSKGFYD